jgi:hypothetical protein
MVDNRAMNYRQLIDELTKHCKEKVSGTIFFNLKSGQSARLVLSQGVIHWIAYEKLRGRKAVESIREIDQAHFNFNPLLKLAIGEQQLPPTIDILKRLYKHNNNPTTVPDLPLENERLSSSNPQIDLNRERLFDQDRVRSILEEEALEYLGPMTRVLCTDYLKAMPPLLNLSQVRQLITALKKDINDHKKGALFLIRVKKALKVY